MFHFLLGEPWQDVLADYDPRYGYFGFLELASLLALAACAALRQAFCMSR